MNSKRFLILIMILVLLSLAAAGCGGSANPAPSGIDGAIEAPAEAVEEADADLGISVPSVPGKTVTDLNEIEGTWIAAAYPGNFVLTIFPDGRLSVATSLEDLQAGNTDTWQLTMEDGEISASDFALCLGDVGSYVATLREDGTMRFTSIIDPCDPRIRKMDRSLPGRLNEYILVYYPVE